MQGREDSGDVSRDDSGKDVVIKGGLMGGVGGRLRETSREESGNGSKEVFQGGCIGGTR